MRDITIEVNERQKWRRVRRTIEADSDVIQDATLTKERASIVSSDCSLILDMAN